MLPQEPLLRGRWATSCQHERRSGWPRTVGVPGSLVRRAGSRMSGPPPPAGLAERCSTTFGADTATGWDQHHAHLRGTCTGRGQVTHGPDRSPDRVRWCCTGTARLRRRRTGVEARRGFPGTVLLRLTACFERSTTAGPEAEALTISQTPISVTRGDLAPTVTAAAAAAAPRYAGQEERTISRPGRCRTPILRASPSNNSAMPPCPGPFQRPKDTSRHRAARTEMNLFEVIDWLPYTSHSRVMSEGGPADRHRDDLRRGPAGVSWAPPSSPGGGGGPSFRQINSMNNSPAVCYRRLMNS